MRWQPAVCFLLLAGGAQLASAGLITQTLGEDSFSDGQQVLSGTWAATKTNPLVDVAPFNGVSCGSDAGAAGSTNCNVSFTFNSYSIPLGDTIVSATILIGIGDLDTHAGPGNQVALFTVGGADLTPALNTLSKATDPCVPTPSTCSTNNAFNNIYRQFTLIIPGGAFAQLASGSTTVVLDTQAPGWGGLGNSPSNGIFLDFSTLDITTQSPAPEPATLGFVTAGLAGLLALRRRRARR